MFPRSATTKKKRQLSADVLSGAVLHEGKLKNGLSVLVAERHLDPVVATMVWYGVGSRDEAPEEAGVSHFLEHMMFKGTQRHGKGAVDRMTTELGGRNNAFTSTDHTAYWFELASDRWKPALELEADRMRNLLLDRREFGTEKAVVLEELSMGADDPWRHLTQEISEVLFRRHAYARPVIGYADVLTRMTPELMRDYYERHYCPSNATVVISGDVAPGPAMRAVREAFGGLASGPGNHATVRRPVPEPKGEWRFTTHWDDQALRLAMAWPTDSVVTDTDYAFDLISTILTGGRLSRLYRSLVLDRRVAVSVGSSNDARVDGGAFWIYAECVPGVAPEKLEQAIDEELARLADETVERTELGRARAILSASEAYGGETVTDIAETLGEYAVDSEWRDALRHEERRAKIRARDIKQAASRYLRPQRRVLGWSLPKGERA
ncbi:MAG: insulinase family protein [bacterium]|nr:insulinase family protein [bacterium]